MVKRVKPKPRVGARRKMQPAETVLRMPLDKIIPYGRNPRTHSDEQIKLLANLMLRYGVDQPIVVDEKSVILKGHGRRLAALRAGLDSFPVVVQRGLSDNDKRALRIADNQSALLSGWDSELIQMEIGELKLAAFDLPLLGFSNAQLMRFNGEENQDTSPQLGALTYAVVIRCQSEDEQRGLLERFGKEGMVCEALIS
jgi:hypothetical protein